MTKSESETKGAQPEPAPTNHAACHAPSDGTACRKWCGDPTCISGAEPVSARPALTEKDVPYIDPIDDLTPGGGAVSARPASPFDDPASLSESLRKSAAEARPASEPTAEVATTAEGKATAWVTTCPYCERTLHIARSDQ